MIRFLTVPALLATVTSAAVAQTATTQTPAASAQTSGPATTVTTATTAQPQTAAPAGTTATPSTSAPAGTAAASTAPASGAMDATKPISANIAAAANLSTLASAVKATGADATLAGAGPFTVFAPSNAAFARLAPADLANLMKPANKPSLTKLVNYHVVAGAITLADLQARMTAGGGKTTLTSVEGEPLVVTLEGSAISLTDVAGHKSYLEAPDQKGANGVVHVVNGVLLPTFG